MLVCMTRLHPLCSAHQHLFTGRCPAVCPVHLYPHTDSFERGVEAMRMVPRLLAGLKTTLHLERVPTLLPLCMMCTQAGFPADEMNRASLAASDQIQIGDQSRCFGLAAMQSSCTVSRSEMGCLTLQSSTVRPARIASSVARAFLHRLIAAFCVTVLAGFPWYVLLTKFHLWLYTSS